MKAYEITVNVKYDKEHEEYIMSKLDDPTKLCFLCRAMYRLVFGKEVTGQVKFILRKIKGRATDYVHPFKIKGREYDDDEAVHIHNGGEWEYAKYLELLQHTIDVEKLKKWAGRSMFSVELEYLK